MDAEFNTASVLTKRSGVNDVYVSPCKLYMRQEDQPNKSSTRFYPKLRTAFLF